MSIFSVVLFLFLVFLFSYGLGSVNSSILISHVFFKKEVRDYGSGNAGTTNMLRTFGKKAALLTFLCDFLKGVVAVGFFQMVVFLFLNEQYDRFYNLFFVDLQYVALFGVILGHIFPVFYEFRGGKGIATAAGSILIIDYRIFLAMILIFLLVVLIFKIVSLGSVIVAAFFLVFNPTYWFFKFDLIGLGFSGLEFWLWVLITTKSTLLVFIIIFKHRFNIKRILSGKEPRIGR